VLIGYHASHEQFAPSDLLQYVRLAEQAGFQAAMCSDHFNPWSLRQGNSAFAWSWLGAALEATRLSFGTVCAPGDRYHPAVVAQAAATLTSMYPGRFWLALGSGEQLNEHITGRPWPEKSERNERLRECAEVIRRLLRGEEVDHDGLVRVDRARLYVVPSTPPPLYAAALTPETAEWAGGWADGLILAPGMPDNARELMRAFRSGGGQGKPVLLQIAIAYGATEEEAIDAAHDQWRHAALEPAQLAELPSPAAFDAEAEGASRDAVREAVFVSSELSEHVELLKEYAGLGPHAAYIHNVSRDQRGYIDAYWREVLPAVTADGSARAV
jgi:coenzyme F420-dependent glucose-6-phosphate dehydrogenase